MAEKNNTVLVLPSWYPSKLDAFDGDFVQRHVQAISPYRRQYVIYVIKDGQGIITNDITVEEKEGENYTEQIIYYHSRRTGIKLLDRLLSQRKYNRIYRDAVKKFIDLKGIPPLVHVHVAMKAGLAALWIKAKWNIPYIVSEHWTGYLPEADRRVEDLPALYRGLLKKIITGAAAVTVVSEHLGKAIQRLFPAINFQVVPNVVDTTVFFPADKKNEAPARFIHVSNMNYQKNAEAILQALHLLNTHPADFTLDLYGPVRPEIKQLVQKLELRGKVALKGEVPQPGLADALRSADALILYSRFETFGCVIIEANACGVPVIVSDLEVFHELVIKDTNGIFVKQDAPAELAKAIRYFIEQRPAFSKTIVAATTKKYTYDTVGKQFDAIYNSIK